MTAIAAIAQDGKVWIGADSAGVGTYTLQIRKDEKVFIKDNIFVIGCTSSFRMMQLLRWSLKIPRQSRNISDEEFMMTTFIEAVRSCFKNSGFAKITESQENGGTFIVGYKGNIYEIHDDFQVAMFHKNYAAVGCGLDLCLGSFFSTEGVLPEERIRLALSCAETFSTSVRGPFVIKCLEK